MQTEGLSGNAAACHGRQRGEEIPRGMVVATTDLQMRSLYDEDEKEVGSLEFLT